MGPHVQRPVFQALPLARVQPQTSGSPLLCLYILICKIRTSLLELLRGLGETVLKAPARTWPGNSH